VGRTVVWDLKRLQSSDCVFRRIPSYWIRPGRSYGFDIYTKRYGSYRLFASCGLAIPREQPTGMRGCDVELFVRAQDWHKAAAEAGAAGDRAWTPALGRIRRIYGDVARFVAGIYHGAAPDDVKAALACTRDAMERILDGGPVGNALVSLAEEHSDSLEHSLRVGVLATALLERTAGSRLLRGGIVRLSAGFILHDIGMARVPRVITRKPQALDSFERTLVQMHPQWGRERLNRAFSMDMEVISIVACHHERPRGRGYPSGMDFSRLGLPARICAVADVFEALTSGRPYRHPLGAFDALRQVYREFSTGGPDDLFGALVNLLASAR